MERNLQFHPSKNLTEICLNRTLLFLCDSMVVNDYFIRQPELLPFCLMSLIIGVTSGTKIFYSGLKNSTFYCMSLTLVGIMMTFAGINDCLIQPQYMQYIIAKMIGTTDVALTSSIAICLFFCGLIDDGWISDNKKTFYNFCGIMLFLWVCWYIILT